MDDVRAVMDAAGSERAAVMGLSEGGPIAIAFAATYPHRTSALVLWNTFASLRPRGAEHPWGYTEEEAEQVIELIKETWGTGQLLPFFVASKVGDESYQEWWSRFERLAHSPGMAADAERMSLNIDVRHLLPALHVPTLVLQSATDPSVIFPLGKYLADNIEDAEFVDLGGSDHFGWHDPNVANELGRFLTGKQQPVDVDRVLTTVLFIDIVEERKRSTQ